MGMIYAKPSIDLTGEKICEICVDAIDDPKFECSSLFVFWEACNFPFHPIFANSHFFREPRTVNFLFSSGFSLRIFSNLQSEFYAGKNLTFLAFTLRHRARILIYCIFIHILVFRDIYPNVKYK